MVEGKTGGAAPRADLEPGVADRVSAGAIAELTRAYGVTLHVERDPDGVRFALTVPIGAPENQAADSVPPPSL
jgi:hypothetical protein